MASKKQTKKARKKISQRKKATKKLGDPQLTREELLESLTLEEAQRSPALAELFERVEELEGRVDALEGPV